MTYLAKLGELTLKGSNIQEFENLLKHNAAKCLEGTGSKIILRAGRLYIDCDESVAPKVEFMLDHLIGITGWAKCQTAEKDIEDIKKVVYAATLKDSSKYIVEETDASVEELAKLSNKIIEVVAIIDNYIRKYNQKQEGI